MQNTNSPDASSYILVSVLLQSERLSEDVELRENVTDVDIFEHMDKPYLTAQVLFIDNEYILEQIDILGAERISITVHSMQEETVPITKNFYISKVLNTEKSGDNIQTVAFHLIEDIGYISNLININRHYSGKSSLIAEKIATNFLNKELAHGSTDKQTMDVIIPNLNPVEALKWIANRTTTNDGYPFYVYSTLVGDKIQYRDLGAILSTPVINSEMTYKYSSQATKSVKPDVRRRSIKSHSFTNNMENLFAVIKKGLVGSRYEYIETITDKQKSFHFDIVKDLYKPLVSAGVMSQNQSNYAFSEKYVHDNKSYNKHSTRTISQLRGSGAYRETDEDTEFKLSFGETRNTAEYKLDIISRAMDNALKKNPLTIIVDGVDFIDGTSHATIGNNLRVEFLVSNPEPGKGEDQIDAKKSGDYLIYSTRHMFKKETYDLALTCVKIGNYKR